MMELVLVLPETQVLDVPWKNEIGHIRCCYFLVVIFSSHHTINLCRYKSSSTFWKIKFNKVSDKLLEKLLVLPAAAKLKTACTKFVYLCPKTFMIKLRAKSKYFFEGDIIRYLL